jgi:hypothetical protein
MPSERIQLSCWWTSLLVKCGIDLLINSDQK